MCGLFIFSCTSCVQNRECSWCPLTLGCYLNSDGCNGQIKPKVSNLSILDSSLPLKIMCGFILSAISANKLSILMGSCFTIFSYMCMFCRSLFVLLYFFFWPLCCLFFDLRILIAPLVSSNSSHMCLLLIDTDCICRCKSRIMVIFEGPDRQHDHFCSESDRTSCYTSDNLCRDLQNLLLFNRY